MKETKHPSVLADWEKTLKTYLDRSIEIREKYPDWDTGTVEEFLRCEVGGTEEEFLRRQHQKPHWVEVIGGLALTTRAG